MVARTWPILQSFEKDQTRQNFVINQISGGLTELAALGGGGITQLTGDVTAGPGSGSVPATVATFGASGAIARARLCT